MLAILRVGVPRVVNVHRIFGIEHIITRPRYAISAVLAKPTSERRHPSVHCAWAMHQFFKWNAAVLPGAVAVVMQIPVLVIKQPAILVHDDRCHNVLEPDRNRAHKNRQSPDSQCSIRAGVLVLQHNGKGPHPTWPCRHTICPDHQTSLKWHPGIIGEIPHKTRRAEFHHAHVSTKSQAAFRGHIFFRPEGECRRVGVSISQRVVVSRAEMSRIQSVLRHRVPSTREVAHPSRDNFHIPFLPCRVFQLRKYTDFNFSSIVKCLRSRLREHKQKAVCNFGREVARATKCPVAISGAARANKISVRSHTPCSQRALTLCACVSGNAPRSKLMLPINIRASHPNHKVHTQQLCRVRSRRIHVLDNVHRIPVAVPIVCIAIWTQANLLSLGCRRRRGTTGWAIGTSGPRRAALTPAPQRLAETITTSADGACSARDMADTLTLGRACDDSGCADEGAEHEVEDMTRCQRCISGGTGRYQVRAASDGSSTGTA
mmetsp:Transcript_100950/g.324053  ORF Transcript_100950/g.324053 Transcript_100950/m.324053 type:complete len:488 (-) Transcript_100950:165-1628(-)